jgi:hypothetical protein
MRNMNLKHVCKVSLVRDFKKKSADLTSHANPDAWAIFWELTT